MIADEQLFFLHFFFCLYSGNVIITSVQNIIKSEGLKGLYRGLSPTILALLPNWAVSNLLILKTINWKLLIKVLDFCLLFILVCDLKFSSFSYELLRCL